jgi:hypothetical protein
MAQTITSFHHDYEPELTIEPINPRYEDRMYISGFLGFIETQYKKEMVGNDGHKEIWMCRKCGREREHKFHYPEIIKVDSFKNN